MIRIEYYNTCKRNKTHQRRYLLYMYWYFKSLIQVFNNVSVNVCTVGILSLITTPHCNVSYG